MIIGLTGMARCGKDTVANYLNERYDFEVMTLSSVIADELKRQGKDAKKKDMAGMGNILREMWGKDIVARKLMERIKSPRVVINGFRSPEEVDYVRQHTSSFYLIYVQAEPEVRFTRKDESDPQKKEEFFARDTDDIEQKGLHKTIQMVDFTVKNNSTQEELYKHVDKIMMKILK